MNHLLPSTEDLRNFAELPSSMDRQKLTNLLIYYKTVCHFVTNDPEEPAPCSITAYAYYYLGQEKKAITYYRRAIKRNDQFFWFHFNLGVIYYNEERYAEASESFVRALSSPDENAKYFFMLTKTYKELAKFLNLTPADYRRNLDKGYELAKELYLISQAFVENPDMRKKLRKEKIDLHLF